MKPLFELLKQSVLAGERTLLADEREHVLAQSPFGEAH